MLPAVSWSQSAITQEQAEAFAETVLGKKPYRVETYFSPKDAISYLAFSHYTRDSWEKRPYIAEQERVWLYERNKGSGKMHLVWNEPHLWPDMHGAMVTSGFVTLQGQVFPCLRMTSYWGGMDAGTHRLGLYCVSKRQPFWVDYFSYSGSSPETGLQRVKVTDVNATDPTIRRYLLSWGHLLGLDVPPKFPNIDAVRRVQQMWLNANGRKACSYQLPSVRWNPWKTNQTDRPTQ
jgi:hypothetical protein